MQLALYNLWNVWNVLDTYLGQKWMGAAGYER